MSFIIQSIKRAMGIPRNNSVYYTKPCQILVCMYLSLLLILAVEVDLAEYSRNMKSVLKYVCMNRPYQSLEYNVTPRHISNFNRLACKLKSILHSVNYLQLTLHVPVFINNILTDLMGICT